MSGVTFFSSWTCSEESLRQPSSGPAHCALEAAVVVEAAPPAGATVNREFWMDSVEVEEA